MHLARVVSNRIREFLRILGAAALENVLVRFGDRLRHVRIKTGISQEKLAEMAGLHRTYVSSVERGLRNISLINIDRLANALDVSLGELMPTKKNG